MIHDRNVIKVGDIVGRDIGLCLVRRANGYLIGVSYPHMNGREWRVDQSEFFGADRARPDHAKCMWWPTVAQYADLIERGLADHAGLIRQLDEGKIDGLMTLELA